MQDIDPSKIAEILFNSTLIDKLEEDSPFYVQLRNGCLVLIEPESDFDFIVSEIESMVNGNYQGVKALSSTEIKGQATLKLTADYQKVPLVSVEEKRPSVKDHVLHELIRNYFKNFDPDEIDSAADLQALISRKFVEPYSEQDGKYEKAYEIFLEELPLPPTVSRVWIEKIIPALLEAGEIQGVPEKAEAYLRRASYTKQEIKELYSAEERHRRFSFSMFVSYTKEIPDPFKINSTAMLDKTIGDIDKSTKTMLYKWFMDSLPMGSPQETIANIVNWYAANGSAGLKNVAKQTLYRLSSPHQ